MPNRHVVRSAWTVKVGYDFTGEVERVSVVQSEVICYSGFPENILRRFHFVRKKKTWNEDATVINGLLLNCNYHGLKFSIINSYKH